MSAQQSQRKFRFHSRPVLVQLTEDEARFLRETPVNQLPTSFLMETRARRIGCSITNLKEMRNYDLARELAEECALLALPGSEFVPAYQPDWSRCDAVAKRETAERMRDFQEFCDLKRQGK